MTRRKNVKRIDPRYFLHETANRNDDGSALEEKRIGSMLDPKTYEHPDPEDPNWPWKPGDSVEGNRPHPYEAEPVLGSLKKRPGESREEYERRIRKGKHRAKYRLPDPGELDPHELAEEELEAGTPPLQEREGETPEDVAARLKSMPASMSAGAVNDFFNMMDGSTDMAGHYPHVEDHREFATQVLKLLGELPASFRYTGRV